MIITEISCVNMKREMECRHRGEWEYVRAMDVCDRK